MSAADPGVELAEQAVAALFSLLSGLDAARGPALAEEAQRDPEAVTAGLVAAILRLVILLHAEARGLLGGPEARPVSALMGRLERGGEAATSAPERAGAWAEIGALFRAAVGPAPAGPSARLAAGARLLDPDATPLLDAPIADATVARVLEQLTEHGGARVAFEALDIEGIGGVYEALLGFGVTVTRGASLALRPDHALVDLDALLARAPDERAAAIEGVTEVLAARARTELAAARSVEELAAALRKRAARRNGARPALIPKGAVTLAPTLARRRSGSHYTPAELTRRIVAATLDPLLGPSPAPESILALRVCDPAMGSGAFLLEACRYLGDRLLAARREDAGDPARRVAALRDVARSCLRGVDKDPIAVDLCRASLWLLTLAPAPLGGLLEGELRCGDSLIGGAVADLAAFPDPGERRGAPLSATQPPASEAPLEGEALERCLDAWTALWFWPARDPERPTRATFERYLAAAAASPAEAPRAASIARRERFLHWETAFPDIFARDPGGFDAILGNPPWVAYAGRAAQPIASEVFDFHRRRSPAFFGYRTLHGLFIHRAATLLRTGGRLGFIVPTSVADLQGYAPTRAAHDHLCEPDPELLDFGADAFAGVFQPAMGLLSTRRRAPASASGPWRVQRADLSREAERLCERLAALPKLPAALFGERGYQTLGEDAPRLKETAEPEPPHTVPLREGRDIGPFLRRPPRLYLDPRGIEPRLRSPDDWREVKILIRQTARYPMAALGDGQPFRNSVLAGFASEEHSAFFLLGYLNSAPIRWFHYTRYRDARQGMPQVKIAHLRGLPAPPRAAGAEETAWRTRLEAIARDAGERNLGLREEEAAAIDALVAYALGLSDAELALVRAWAAGNPVPRSTSG